MFNIFNRFLPSLRIGTDPIQFEDRSTIKPISVSRLRVNAIVKRKILDQRKGKRLDFSFYDNSKAAVIIPFRDRAPHLEQLLPVLTGFLNKQQIKFEIIVVEQTAEKPFNRGKLKNVGAAFSASDCDYFIFHDVDLIPIEADYRCPSSPLRVVKEFSCTWRINQVLAGTNFGGVVSFLKQDFSQVNGYSNRYWGWGKEDDDLFIRTIFSGLIPCENAAGLFSELENPNHQDRSPEKIVKRNKKRKSRLLRGLEDFGKDGLSDLEYKIVHEEVSDQYRKICVQI
jgi:hypothetical protein